MTINSAHTHILAINSGSSSIKFALFETDSLSEVLQGEIERIGLPGTVLRAKGLREVAQLLEAPDYAAAVSILMDWIEKNCERQGLAAIGHRIVHGGRNIAARSRSLKRC